MKYEITIFNSDSITKVPKSPDQEFTFQSLSWDTDIDKDINLSMFSVLSNHFILNTPLNIQQPTKRRRRTSDLEEFFPEKINYLILDIDQIPSESNKQHVLDYFKDFKVIIGESRSFNGSTNFNLKGILFIEEMDKKSARFLLEKFKTDLQDKCILDEAVLRNCTLNAPILKNIVLLNNELGECVKRLDISTSHLKKIQDSYSISTDMNLTGNVEDVCLSIFSSMGFSAIKDNTNGSISFSHVAEVKSPGGYFWFSKSPFTMHHPNPIKSVNIYNTIKKLPNGKELLQRSINYDMLLKKDYSADVYFYDEEYLSIENKEEIITKWLEAKNGMLSISSPMGSAKSTIIYHAIEQAISMDFKILIVTNRISVAEDFSEKYNIPLYYNTSKSNTIGSLIIQYDSLQNYSMKFFDLVILDEFQSLCYHARNNIKNSELNIKKFFATFKKKIIVADAFLTGYENEIIGKYSNCVRFVNQYRNDVKLFEYSNKNNFFVEVLKAAKTQKITISATSLNVIKGLRYVLEKSNPELKVITLTSETPSALKSLIYKSFVQDEVIWDVLIFSPTLTVGVSILSSIDKHFHFDGGKSANVISSLQMMKRTRKAKEIHYFINESLQVQPISFNTLKDFYISFAKDNMFFECDSNGDEVFSNIGELITKIDVFNNIIQFNNKNAFRWLLQYQFKNAPEVLERKSEPFIERAIKKCMFDPDSYVEDFLVMSEMDRSEMSNIKSISNLDDVLNSINTSDPEIIKSILTISYKKKDFIDCVKNFRMVSLDKKTLQMRLSSEIKQNNLKNIEFIQILLSDEIQSIQNLKSWYSAKEVSNNFKKFLSLIGYNFRASRWQINKDILTYKEYII